MQKEDLLKRIRILATVATMAFAVLIVGLIIQFGMIAYHNAELTRLQDSNQRTQQQIENIDNELSYIKDGEFGSDYQKTH